MTQTPIERAAYELALAYFQANGITDYLDGELDDRASQFLLLFDTYSECFTEDGHFTGADPFEDEPAYFEPSFTS